MQIASLEREKVLYEIAMAIGNTLDIHQMSKDILQVLLKKLSGTSAAIFDTTHQKEVGFENIIVSIPRRINAHPIYHEIFDTINTHPITQIVNKSPNGSFFYLFVLENFGYLVLIRDEQIEPLILQSLQPIMGKVTTSLQACILHNKLQKSLDEAKSADQAKSQFLANMSHEIRTPLNGIIGFLNMLKLSDLTPKQQHYIDVINTSSQTLLQVINDILDFSKIEAGELNIEYLPFDLHQEFSMLFELFLAQIDTTKIDFSFDIDKSFPPTIISDKVRLKQIMVNLINNAIKFTKSGEITVTVKLLQETPERCSWRVSVKDTGIGIAKEKLSLILEPFKQSNNSITREYGGTGLGLSITKELITLLGGTLEVTSLEGKGSQFSFVLNSDKGKTPLQESIKVDTITHFNQASILVVEDNLMNQVLMSEILESLQIHFDIAENGQVAYDKFIENHYDLVLMDHSMPILDGEQALHLILNFEKEHQRKHTPIIVLTASALHGDKERFMKMGFDAYMSKPISMDNLKQLLHRFLDNRPH